MLAGDAHALADPVVAEDRLIVLEHEVAERLAPAGAADGVRPASKAAACPTIQGCP